MYTVNTFVQNFVRTQSSLLHVVIDEVTDSVFKFKFTEPRHYKLNKINVVQLVQFVSLTDTNVAHPRHRRKLYSQNWMTL